MIYKFDNCVLNTATQELSRGGDIVHVEPQVLAVLSYLAQHSDRVVTKIELLDEVWGDRFVSESALTSRIKLARKACGDNGRDQRIVKTVHSRGYRFASPVSVHDASPTSEPSNPAVAPPAPETDLGPIGPAAATRTSTTVFGRNADIAVLHTAAEEARHGARRSVFVCGGLGIGKSALVAEFLEQLDVGEDWAVAHGQCIRTRGGVEPYFCLLDALAGLAHTEHRLVAEALELVAPSWLAQMPQLVDQDALVRLERRLLGSTPSRMLREGAEAFGAIARKRPLIMILEDLQWADDCTLDVLELLVQRNDSARLLLIGVGSPETTDLGPIVHAAANNGGVRVVELEPLDVGNIARLAHDRLDGVVDDELAAIIHRRSGGVPLFAEEIIAAWRRDDVVDVADGTARATVALDALDATIPATLPPLIERELGSLSADERTTLEACAVAGDTFESATVAAILDQTVIVVEQALAALARHRGLIGATGAVAWPDGTISAAYAFTQQLFREVIDDGIPASHRAALHARAGAALEAGFGDRSRELAVVLADHFVQAGQARPAAHHLRVAGEQAAARSAHGHAMEFFTRALDQIATLPASDDRDTAELYVRSALGPTLVATKGWFDPSVSENYERALALCGTDSLRTEAAAARYGLATVSELRGQFERTEALLAPLLSPDAPGHLALEAHELVACSTFHQGAFDRSLRTATEVLQSWDADTYSVLMARIAEHPASSCSSWSSLALWALGRSDDSLELAERAVDLGEQNLYALSTAVQQRAMLHQLRNEPEACIEWSKRCRQVGEDQNFPMRTIQADIYMGWAEAATGDPEHGIERIDQGLRRFRDAGATLNEAYYLGMYADALMRGGDHERAGELLNEALAGSTSRTYFYEAELHRLRGRSRLAAGDPDDARREFDQAMDIARTQGAAALELRAVLDRFELADDDTATWRSALESAARVYDGQRPVPDAERARRLLSA